MQTVIPKICSTMKILLLEHQGGAFNKISCQEKYLNLKPIVLMQPIDNNEWTDRKFIETIID